MSEPPADSLLPAGSNEKPRLALVMVGLPARGKTYVARKLMRYLNWLGHPTSIFNVGNYRREKVGSEQSHQFFDPGNPVGARIRRELALLALDDMLGWLDNEGHVGIYDATNSTHGRRELILDRCKQASVKVIFIESICDARTVENNIRDTKLDSPDYANADPEAAVADFRKRIAHYESTYQTVDEQDGSYIKLIDVGRQVIVNRLEGYLPSRLISFLVNLHNVPRPVWLTRHGQTIYNVQERIGGDSPLSPDGEQYARSLNTFYEQQIEPLGDVAIWTSTLQRTLQTAATLGRPHTPWRALNEIDAGECDALTYAEIKTRFPREWEARTADKFSYRYPRGESYIDVIQRVETVTIEIERQRHPVLVVGHQAVLRAFYGYLMGIEPRQIPHLHVPLHTVIELQPKAYGYEERRHCLPPAVSPHSGSSS